MNRCLRRRGARLGALAVVLVIPLLSLAWTYSGVGWSGSTSVPGSGYAWSGHTQSAAGASHLRTTPCPWLSGAYVCYPETFSGLNLRVSGVSSTTHAYTYHQVQVSWNWSPTEETYDAN